MLVSFSEIFLGFIGVTRYVVSDVPIDDEAPVVTSGIFRSAGLNPSEMLIGVGFAYVYS